MQQLLKDIFGKVFRAKCPHGCEHAGEGVLFKFSKGPTKDVIHVLEISLDHRDNLLAVCTFKQGSSDNWLLLSVKNEYNPYTYAVHRLANDSAAKTAFKKDNLQFEIYISREGTADNYPLEEVDPRYEDVDFFVNRASRKYSRHESRSRSRSRSHSRSDSDDFNDGPSEDSHDSDRDRDNVRAIVASSTQNAKRGAGPTTAKTTSAMPVSVAKSRSRTTENKNPAPATRRRNSRTTETKGKPTSAAASKAKKTN